MTKSILLIIFTPIAIYKLFYFSKKIINLIKDNKEIEIMRRELEINWKKNYL